jgi:hypothetical protein
VNDDNNLRGWQLLVLLAFCCGVAVLLLLVGWTARPNWLWDKPLIASAIAGAAWFPMRLLVEKREWWKRLGGRHDRARVNADTVGVDDDDSDDLDGRQLVVLLAYFGGVMGVLLLIGLLTRPSVLWSSPELDAAIAGVTCYPARFLVERTTWWRQLQTPKVRVADESKLKGVLRRVRRVVLIDRLRLAAGWLVLAVGCTLLPLLIVGDGHPLSVFADSFVLDASWYDFPLLAVICLGIAGIVSWPFFGTVRLRRADRRAVARLRTWTMVVVTEVELSSKSSDAYVTFEADGQVWRLVVNAFDPFSLPPGTSVPLAGELSRGAWVTLLTSPPLRPAAHLDHRGPMISRRPILD